MTLIQGADIKVELDIGYRPPLRAVEWSEVTCEVMSMDWMWGAQQPLGPLTECENGRLRLSLYDPDRKYDPTNPDSPIFDALKVGMPMKVTIDATPAWTGALNSWARDPLSVVSDLFGHDTLGELSVKQLPRDMQTNPGATDFQVKDLYDQVAWPDSRRFFATTGGEDRGAQYLRSSLLDMLLLIRYTELGALYAMRDGRVGWWNRAGPAPPAPRAVINCDGVALTSFYDLKGPNRVRNRVKWSGNYGLYGGVGLPDDFIRDANPDVLELQMGTAVPQPHARWSWIVLDALAEPAPLAVLGTIIPVGGEVVDVVCSEFGDRWTVNVSDTETREVEVLGMTVDVRPGWLEVNAVTEDIPVDTGERHAVIYADYQRVPEAFYDSWIRSEDPSYSVARAGTGAKNVLVGADPLNIVGQKFTPIIDPQPQSYEVWESFFSFDTSVIPDTATVTSVTLVTWHHVLPSVPAMALTLEARSKTWTPAPLATADYVPGATLSTLPLRASLALVPLTPAQITPPDYNQFSTQGRLAWTSDPSFPAAINKTGRTDLVISTDRLRLGTAPTNGVNEVINLYSADATPTGGGPETGGPINSGPYLDINYTVPVTGRSFRRRRTELYFGEEVTP